VSVHEQLLEIEALASYPLSAIARAAGGGPLFAATFNFISFPRSRPTARATTGPSVVARRSVDNLGFHYPVNLLANAQPDSETIDLRFEFDGQTFTEADVARLSRRLVAALEEA
jgi:hypothetical protein